MGYQFINSFLIIIFSQLSHADRIEVEWFFLKKWTSCLNLLQKSIGSITIDMSQITKFALNECNYANELTLINKWNSDETLRRPLKYWFSIVQFIVFK